jgi:hypothetical protein
MRRKAIHRSGWAMLAAGRNDDVISSGSSVECPPLKLDPYL